MSEKEIVEAAAAGIPLSSIAKRSGLPITQIHRIVHGAGKSMHAPRRRVCRMCGNAFYGYARKDAPCPACVPAHFKAQQAAMLAVRKAVRAGLLPRVSTQSCTDCGVAAQQYDHRDYAAPLVVDPVCKSCNSRRGPAK